MRVQGWEKILSDYITNVAEKDFQWGVCDCLIFVSDAALLSCGKDPMSKIKPEDPETIRGLYSTEYQAARLIAQYRDSLHDIMDVHFKPIKPPFAQRGDIVCANLETGDTFGLCWNGKAFFKSQNKGFKVTSLKECSLAWRVE